MKQTDQGYIVQRGSTIQITSRGQNISQNLTSFPFEADCSCSNMPIAVTNDGLSRTGQFQAPNTACHCVIEVIFDFKPDDDPTKAAYNVEVTEIIPGSVPTTIKSLFPVTPPPPSRRMFVIVTE